MTLFTVNLGGCRYIQLFITQQSNIGLLESNESKYIKYAYQMMLNHLEEKPNIVNWASKLRDLLSSLGFQWK